MFVCVILILNKGVIMPVWEVLVIIFSCVLGFLILTSLSVFVLTAIRLFEINFLVPFEFKLSGYRNDKQRLLDDFSWFDSQQMEELTIKSFDNKKLRAQFLRCENSQKTAICFHGYRAKAKNDLSGVAQYFLSLGYNVLFVNQRSHGKSRGLAITFGIKEKNDVKTWAEFMVNNLKQEELILYGVSMGASTILMSSSLNLPKNVKAMIADCGYTSPFEMIKIAAKFFHIPIYPTIWFIQFYYIVFCHINIKKYSTLDAVKDSSIPTLYIHGTKDLFIPYEMSKQNFETQKENKELLLVEGASHAGSYVKDTALYQKTVFDFLKKYENF